PALAGNAAALLQSQPAWDNEYMSAVRTVSSALDLMAKAAASFARDPLEAVVGVLEAAGVPLSRAAILQRLAAGGVPEEQAARSWKGVRRRLKAHDKVTVEGVRYRWSPDGQRDLSVFEAINLLAEGGLRAPRRKELADLIRTALGDEQERSVRRR